MLTEDFNHIVKDLLNECEDTLLHKAAEYATEDRLHNFRVAAELQGVSMQEALAGMMAKHTVSIYDLCNGDFTPDRGLWDEKLTDHINYLLLLKAVFEEKMSELNN